MADRGARRSRQRSFAGFAEIDTTEGDHAAEAGALPAVEPALVLTFFATGLGPEPTDGHWSGDPLAPVVPDLHAAQRGRVVRAESYAVGRHGPQAQPFAINATGCVGRVLQAALPAPLSGVGLATAQYQGRDGAAP